MKLYIDHYSDIYRASGKPFVFAAREGILRDYHEEIMVNLSFLRRKGLEVLLYHNISPNTGNNTFIGQSLMKGGVELYRTHHQSVDFYTDVIETVSEVQGGVEKLILLERNMLLNNQGERLNTIAIDSMKQPEGKTTYDFSTLSERNKNFRATLKKLCDAISQGKIHRAHILKAGRRNAIKDELFSIEGSGTLLGKDFGKPEISEAREDESEVVFGILKGDKTGLIKKRSKDYISHNISNFLIARIDRIPVGCVEKKVIDFETIELGALCVIQSFLSHKIGISLINTFQDNAVSDNKNVICFTNNKKLQSILISLGYVQEDQQYFERRSKSVGVNMYLKEKI